MSVTTQVSAAPTFLYSTPYELELTSGNRHCAYGVHRDHDLGQAADAGQMEGEVLRAIVNSRVHVAVTDTYGIPSLFIGTGIKSKLDRPPWRILQNKDHVRTKNTSGLSLKVTVAIPTLRLSLLPFRPCLVLTLGPRLVVAFQVRVPIDIPLHRGHPRETRTGASPARTP